MQTNNPDDDAEGGGGTVAGDGDADLGVVAVDDPRGRKGWRVVRPLFQAAVISIIVSAALALLTIRTDDRRAKVDRLLAREQDWRTRLVAEADYPRAALRGLDLSGAYASAVGLAGSDLRGTNFSGATLVGARLDGVQASDANFSEATMNGAVLAAAVLTKAKFQLASLNGADLRGAMVDGADFSGARLFRTDVRGVDMRRTVLDGTDLRYVCFDKGTHWPPGLTPDRAFCSAEEESSRPLGGTQYAIELFLVDDIPAAELPLEYARELNLTDDSFTVVVYFSNLGVVPLQDVAFVSEIPEALDVSPGTIRITNGDHPDGYGYPDSALQAEGRQVHIGLGSFRTSGANAYVTFEVRTRPGGCGTGLPITAYVTPKRFGTIFDRATATVAC